MEQQETQELDRKDLVIMSMKQRFAEKITDYEDEINNLRADYTILIEQAKALEKENKELKGEDAEKEDDADASK